MSLSYSELNLNELEKDIAEEILGANPYNKEFISTKLEQLIESQSLQSVLIILFRQQVDCGFVISDPKSDKLTESKYISDPATGINFQVQWNPNRELRLKHDLLIKKGVINNDIANESLINVDSRGKPCYLCLNNIELQNPLEILLRLELAERRYCCGANFSPITDNHFTIMSEEHKPQDYDLNFIRSMLRFVDKTNGIFKAIFNGKAGASILCHLHFQGTTQRLPIQDISMSENDLVLSDSAILVYKPNFYVPLFVLDGESIESITDISDKLIMNWRSLDPEFHTQNILVEKENKKYRVFIYLRDTRRLSGAGKIGDMGTFECSGLLVLSRGTTDNINGGTEERALFEESDLNTIKNLLTEIAPDRRPDIGDLL